MTRARRGLLIAAGIVVAFGIGFGWQYMRAERLETELAETRQELVFTHLEATLAAAAVEAQQGGYEPARRLTSDFFSGLQARAGEAPPEQGQELETILGRRDQLITLLSRGDPAGRDLLVRTFRQYRIAVGGPERAMPVTTPAETGAAPEAGGEPEGAEPAQRDGPVPRPQQP